MRYDTIKKTTQLEGRPSVALDRYISFADLIRATTLISKGMLGQIEVVCSLQVTTVDPTVHTLRRLRCLSAQCSTLRRFKSSLMPDLSPFLSSTGSSNTVVEIDVSNEESASSQQVAGPAPSSSTIVTFPKDLKLSRLRFFKASGTQSLNNVDGINATNTPLLAKLILGGTGISSLVPMAKANKATSTKTKHGTELKIHSQDAVPHRLPPNLSFVDVSRCSKLKSIDPLASLDTLTRLDISHTQLISAVPSLVHLETLNAFNSQIKSIGHCPKLIRLNITKCKHIKSLPRLESIECLHAGYATNLHALQALAGSQTLTDLNLSNNDELTTLPRLPKLKRLVLSYAFGIQDWGFLDSFKDTIEELQLADCDGLSNFPLGFGKDTLRVLNVSGIRTLLDLSCIDGSKSMQVLDLSRCESIRPKLPLFPNLVKLTAPSSGLRDIGSLSKASHSLIELNISGTYRIVSLPRLPNLEVLCAAGSDLVDVSALQNSAIREVMLPKKAAVVMSKLPKGKFPQLRLFSTEDGGPFAFSVN